MTEAEGVNYGYNLSEAVVGLALQAEEYGAKEIERIEGEIQGHLDLLDAVRKLKAAIVKASSDGAGSIDFNENKELIEAYEAFAEIFGEEDADILPTDGIVPQENVPDVLRILDGLTRRPATLIEYLMTIGVVRRVNDLDVMIDCSKDIIKSNAEEIRNKLRMMNK